MSPEGNFATNIGFNSQYLQFFIRLQKYKEFSERNHKEIQISTANSCFLQFQGITILMELEEKARKFQWNLLNYTKF